jgi:hypothetical protein
MQRFPRYYLLTTAVLAATVLAASLGQRFSTRAAALRSLDDWDIPELVDHLNRSGLHVRSCSLRKDGVPYHQMTFLTITDKDWDELNHLSKDPERISEWRGIVSCERVGTDREPILHLWGDHYLVVGPFVFFGDAELLERIAAILLPSAPPAAP